MVKNEPKLDFEKSKEIYKTFLMRVKKGVITWKDISDMDRIETEVVLKCISLQEKPQRTSKLNFKKKQPDIIWCKDYNKGTCKQNDNYDQLFQGKMVKVCHICRKCYSKKKKNTHKELDAQCLFNE